MKSSILLRIVAVLLASLVAAVCVAQPITLRFTVWDGDVSLKVIQGILTQFEKENPDIHVKLEPIPDYNVYHQKMITLYAAHAAPDVAMMDPGHFQGLAKRGAFLPLNPLFNNDPKFLGQYYKPLTDAMTYKGQLYVLPRDIAPEGIIYYNKKLFDEAHIPYPDGSWTWDWKERPELKEKDFLWVMHQLTKKRADGKQQFGYLPSGSGLLADMIMYSSGVKPTDDYEHPTKVLYDTPEMHKVYHFVDDLISNKKWMPSQADVSSLFQSTTTQMFIRQQAAMYQNGIWEVPNIRHDMPPGSPDWFDWDIALAPAYVHGDRSSDSGGSGYGIFSSTRYPEQAWRLTKFMGGPVAMAAMARAGIAQPAIRSVALTDVWIPGPNTPKDQQWPHNRIATDQAVPYVKYGATADYWPSVMNVVNARIGGIWDKSLKVDDALHLATVEGQQRLDQLIKDEHLPAFNWQDGLIAALLIVAAILIAIYLPERKVRYTRRQKQESRAAYRFLSPWLVGLIIFTVGPMILSLLMSTMSWDMIMPAQWRGGGNFKEAFTQDPSFWPSIRVTLAYTLISTPLGIFFAFLLALLLNQKVRGVPLFRAAFYVPSIASAVASALIARKVFAPDDGLFNKVLYSPVFEKLGWAISSWAGDPKAHVNWFNNEKTAMAALIMLGLWGVGGSMVILLAGLQSIPQFYYEAATVDGASPFQKLKAITVPLLTPSLFFTLVTGFIGSFQIFTQVYVITGGSGGGPNNSLLVYMVNLFDAAFQQDRMGYAAALAWVLFFIILGFTLLQLAMSKWVYYEAEAK
ncbi:MAG TPA: extracellular solute-binding protein [Fimbriimonas sp.]|nr:extracellular solute-binding protein [Fimbriimonas sp.]